MHVTSLKRSSNTVISNPTHFFSFKHEQVEVISLEKKDMTRLISKTCGKPTATLKGANYTYPEKDNSIEKLVTGNTSDTREL